MIERQIIKQKINEFQITEFISANLKRIGHSHTKLQRTPLGEKIVIYASKPGLVIGKKGQTIKKITADLKKKYNLDNPQIETIEVENPFLDANIVAETIVSALEQFGAARFKGIGHKMMESVMNAGAMGVEIIIGGRGVPSTRAKSWRFYRGYLKKCGNIAVEGVENANASAQLKSGTIGIKVSIMPPGLKLPDKITLIEEVIVEEAEVKETEEKKAADEKKEEPAKEKTAGEKIENIVHEPKEFTGKAKKKGPSAAEIVEEVSVEIEQEKTKLNSKGRK